MRMWPCFVCESESVCAHREPELVAWFRALQTADPRTYAAAIAHPIPTPSVVPAPEHAPEARVH